MHQGLGAGQKKIDLRSNTASSLGNSTELPKTNAKKVLRQCILSHACFVQALIACTLLVRRTDIALQTNILQSID
jgi:hypothetical protein